MEPKPSRLPRRATDQPSTTSHLSSSVIRRSRLGGYSDSYHSRDYSRSHDLDYQEPGTLPSSRDWTRDRYSFEPSWKTPSSYQRCSGTYDHSLSRGFGNRSRVSTSSSSSSSSSSWYEPPERAQSSYTGLHSQQQDCDSKRPKLSYSGCPSLSGISGTQGLNSAPDSSRYGRFPRTSSLMLGSTGSDLARERRSESSVGGTDYRNRNLDSTRSYLQDRVSSYAQGARPKETTLSTSRLNTSSLNRQLPSQHSSSFLSRNSRLGTSVEPISSLRDVQSDYRHATRRNEGDTTSTRVSTAQRSTNEQPTDTDGRRTTRHLLSRLASMSSTFFSRRSSQDSLNGRTPESEEAQPCLHEASQTNVSTSPSADISENRASDQSQGFVFLRRRRLGMPTATQSQSSDSDADSNRSEESETRTSASWLPSSIRNRCTPLFSRRRREGRDETARATSTSDTSRSHNPFRRASREDHLSEAQVNSQGAAASSSRSSTSSTASSASLVDSILSRSNSGISGMLPNSFLHFSVPAALGNTLSENVMITVDIVPSGRTSDESENEKSQTSSRDPEKLKKIQESLLLEDSDEEEDDLCRICQTGMSTPTNPFIQPCKCSGSLQYVHQDCMKKWLEAKINSGSSLETITTCELCKEKLELNLEDFDLQELYRSHANERAEYEFISSGLYLVVLLHLCEQRFSDMLGAANEASSRVRFISLARALQAHMEDLDTSEDDSEDERV